MARYCQIVYAFLMFLLAAPPQMLLAEKPSLVDGELVVNIDAATNRGGTEFHLRNDTNRPMSIVLHVGKFVLQTTGRTVPATVAFERGASEKAGPFLEAKLEPEDVLFIRLEVSGFGEAGEAHAILFDRGTSLTVVKAVKFNVPFALSLITTDADNPESEKRTISAYVVPGLAKFME